VAAPCAEIDQENKPSRDHDQRVDEKSDTVLPAGERERRHENGDDQTPAKRTLSPRLDPQLAAELAQRRDRLALHLGPDMRGAEASLLEQPGQPLAGAVRRRALKGAAQILARGLERAAAQAVPGQRALHRRVSADHRPAWIGFRSISAIEMSTCSRSSRRAIPAHIVPVRRRAAPSSLHRVTTSSNTNIDDSGKDPREQLLRELQGCSVLGASYWCSVCAVRLIGLKAGGLALLLCRVRATRTALRHQREHQNLLERTPFLVLSRARHGFVVHACSQSQIT